MQMGSSHVSMSQHVDIRDVEVVAPNFKKRLSGVTSVIVQLIPEQRAAGTRVATLGPGLPDSLPGLKISQLPGLLSPPSGRPFRVWHARRNTEMLAGLVLKRLFRAPLKLLFTSAAQRKHTRYTRWLIRQMDSVVTTSSRSAGYLEVQHTIIPHGIDLEAFHPPSDDERDWSQTGLPGKFGIGCFGRVRPQKGTDLYVDALIELLPDNPDWTGLVFGRVTADNRGFCEELQDKIDAAGLHERIVFMGEVPDVKPWLRRVSLCVAPSRNEGFGLTPLEAMASETAVVTSDAGAYRDIVAGGETGFVVPADDKAALVMAMKTCLDDPALVSALAASGLERVRAHYALRREAEALAAVYETLWATG
jgi:mannosyltransferase